jgi:hypothetical protein
MSQHPPLSIELLPLLNELGNALRNLPHVDEQMVHYFFFSCGLDERNQQVTALQGIDIKTELTNTLLLAKHRDANEAALHMLNDANNHVHNIENCRRIENNIRQDQLSDVKTEDFDSLHELLGIC